MRARVDLEVLGTCEHLPAVREGAGERLLPGVNPNVIDQFVFGFERLASPQTLVPHADMAQGLQSDRDVLGGDVVHQLMHGAETLVADGRRCPVDLLSRRSSVGLGPFANQLGFDGGAFGVVQQAVYSSSGNVGGGGGNGNSALLGRRSDVGGPGVVVPQRRDEAIVPGYNSRPLHANLGGLPPLLPPNTSLASSVKLVKSDWENV